MFKPERTKVIKTLLVSCALIIAEAMQSFMRADENTDLNLVLRIINSNHTIPVILLDEQNHVIDYRNITFSASTDTTAYLASEARAMREGGHSMQLSIDNMPGHFTLCYGESTMLKRLAVYPYIQLAVVGQGMGGTFKGNGPPAWHADFLPNGMDGGVARTLS